MAKAELAAAQSQYDDLMRRAQEAEARGDPLEAVRLAREAWPFLPDMMRYEKRYEGATFASVPCIDLVLKYAPPLLDTESLEALADLLKQNRAIDRDASDDLASRLTAAQSLLKTCSHLVSLLERAGHINWSRLSSEAQATGLDLRGAAQMLATVGIVRVSTSGPCEGVAFNDIACLSVRAACSGCGHTETMSLEEAIGIERCPACEQRETMCIGNSADR